MILGGLALLCVAAAPLWEASAAEGSSDGRAWRVVLSLGGLGVAGAAWAPGQSWGALAAGLAALGAVVLTRSGGRAGAGQGMTAALVSLWSAGTPGLWALAPWGVLAVGLARHHPWLAAAVWAGMAPASQASSPALALIGAVLALPRVRSAPRAAALGQRLAGVAAWAVGLELAQTGQLPLAAALWITGSWAALRRPEEAA